MFSVLPGWGGAVLVRCRTVKHEMTILDKNRESPIEKTWNLRRRMVGYLEVLFIVSALGAFSPVEEAGKILLRVHPRDRTVVLRIGFFDLVEFSGVNDAPAGGRFRYAEFGVQHFVEDDVMDEKAGYEGLIEEGMHANDVFVRRIASEADGASSPLPWHFSPGDSGIDFVVEVLLVDVVEQGF